MQKERLHQFSDDLLTLALLWGKNFTVTESAYTFTVLYERQTVNIRRRNAGKFGGDGSPLLAALQRFKSGATDMQWFLTAPNM